MSTLPISGHLSGMTPDYISPEVGWPLAAVLWAIAALPHVAAWSRARRRARLTTSSKGSRP